jgi:hypothetical protein
VNTLTTLSPIVPERLGELKHRLRVVRYVPGLGRPLLELGFIHYARWSIIDGLPSAGGGWRGLRSKYLLFQSSFDGEEQDYLDAFADVLPARLAKMWGACVGFEANVERVRGARGRIVAPYAFRDFVKLNSLDLLAHYDAYEYPASTVRQAIGMEDRIAAAGDDYAGREALLDRIPEVGSMALGPAPGPLTTKERVRAVCKPWVRAVRGRYGVNPLTVVLPLKPGAPSVETQALWEKPKSSPLEALDKTDTHFARLAVIPPQVKDVGQPSPDRLDGSYLLYTSDFGGNPYSHIERLFAKRAAMVEIWKLCEGFTTTMSNQTFHAWLDDHTIPTRYYVAGYPPRRVDEIDRYVVQRTDVRADYKPDDPPSPGRLIKTWDDAGHD